MSRFQKPNYIQIFAKNQLICARRPRYRYTNVWTIFSCSSDDLIIFYGDYFFQVVRFYMSFFAKTVMKSPNFFIWMRQSLKMDTRTLIFNSNYFTHFERFLQKFPRIAKKYYTGGGQYLRPNIAEFTNISEIFWQKIPVIQAPSTKGVPNIAEIFGQKTFGDIGPPCINIKPGFYRALSWMFKKK